MSLDATASNSLDANELRIKRSKQGTCRVACGFELASYAIPTRFDPTSHGNEREQGQSFLGENTLAKEIYGALLPLLESIPDDASLLVEYHFSPVSEGIVSFRNFILVETPAAKESDAVAEATRLRTELALALSVLSDWYSFKPASFATAKSAASAYVVRILPGCREVSIHNHAGFTPSAFSFKQVLLPAIAPNVPEKKGRTSLLFSSNWSKTVGRILLAARTLTQPLSVSICLTRESIPLTLHELFIQAKKGRVGKVYEGGEQDDYGKTDAKESFDLDLDIAGDNFLDDLSAQSVAMRLKVEVTSVHEISEVFLRVIGLDVFPGAPVRLEYANTGKEEGKKKPELIDLSDMLPYPHWLPPLLPSPPSLERIHFQKHYSNSDIRLSDKGMELGRAQCGGFERPVFISQADRTRHMYLLGATGTGKSTLIYNMVRQDMEAGHGVAVVDPHGDLFEQVLSAVPEHRVKDVVIIDPSDQAFPVGLNPLDLPENVSPFILNRVINDLLDIFGKLYDMREAGGPMFELYFRNSFKLAVGAPREIYKDHPLSFESIARILRDSNLREKILSSLSPDDPVRTFFEQAAKTRGEHDFENLVPYITSKLTRFVDNPLLKSIICSPKRTIDFRKVMDEKKILLVNLVKGDLGAFDTRMVGMLITNYLFEAALERANSPKDKRTPFYYYLDEFQNFATDTVADMLAEARKYGLHLILANQTLSQLMNRGLSHERALLESVLGNVATKLCMRVGLDDAKLLEPHFLPQFNGHTLSQMPDRHVISRMLVDGRPSEPFVFSTLPPKPLPQTTASKDVRTRSVEFSRQKYSMPPSSKSQ
ncbi:MAG: type IV secretion system DNA-binding domain-containing protein [Candidatus Nitrotoga sp.]